MYVPCARGCGKRVRCLSRASGRPDICDLHVGCAHNQLPELCVPLIRGRCSKRYNETEHRTEHSQQRTIDPEVVAVFGYEHHHCTCRPLSVARQRQYVNTNALVAMSVKNTTSGQMSLITVALKRFTPQLPDHSGFSATIDVIYVRDQTRVLMVDRAEGMGYSRVPRRGSLGTAMVRGQRRVQAAVCGRVGGAGVKYKRNGL